MLCVTIQNMALHKYLLNTSDLHLYKLKNPKGGAGVPPNVELYHSILMLQRNIWPVI